MGTVCQNKYKIQIFFIIIETNFVDKSFRMEYQDRSPIDTIESRLSNIERRVYGKSNPSFKEKEDASSELAGGVVPRLTDIAKEVGNAISTRERVVPLFRRLKELESYMDPSFGESKGLPAELKVEMILAQEEKIRKSAELLKDIQEKSAVLNADAILTYTQPECERNLINLSTIQLEQEVKCNRLNESTLELVEKYNDVISTIAETFVRYDEMLRALEDSKSSTSIESR